MQMEGVRQSQRSLHRGGPKNRSSSGSQKPLCSDNPRDVIAGRYSKLYFLYQSQSVLNDVLAMAMEVESDKREAEAALKHLENRCRAYHAWAELHRITPGGNRVVNSISSSLASLSVKVETKKESPDAPLLAHKKRDPNAKSRRRLDFEEPGDGNVRIGQYINYAKTLLERAVVIAVETKKSNKSLESMCDSFISDVNLHLDYLKQPQLPPVLDTCDTVQPCT